MIYVRAKTKGHDKEALEAIVEDPFKCVFQRAANDVQVEGLSLQHQETQHRDVFNFDNRYRELKNVDADFDLEAYKNIAREIWKHDFNTQEWMYRN